MDQSPATRAAAALAALVTVICVQGCAGAHRPAAGGVRFGQPASKSLGATVESSDPGLAAALTKTALLPTPAAHRAVAREYRRLKVDDAAFDHLKAALRLDPADAAAYDELARIWRDWGFADLGMADASRALYYAPKSAAAHNTMGTLLSAVGQQDAARRAFETALALDPSASFARENLRRLAALTGQPADRKATGR
jgi:tetratricopeptide (TPR) repeat protein